MSLPLLAVIVLGALALGYRFYGGFIARQYRLDASTVTPAEKVNDGIDFVPTKPFYLLGQHFSAIAAAGPIAGPILACQQFGWLPSILWIVLGVIFIGAVHDFSTLLASVRHEARSIAEVIRLNLGRRAWLAMMAFIWIALVYVIVAFTDITAVTFVSGDVELAGLSTKFNQGGAVAAASTIYLTLAILMGLVDRALKPPLWLQTLIFVPATFGAVWLGTEISQWLRLELHTWAIIILVYCFVASLTPVWALLQPRGYLGGFVLYSALLVGIIGIFFGGFPIQQQAYKGFDVGGSTGLLFPFLFVTIACGACSGFHGLVCSGTTSKQIAKETHCHPVGYGAMLLEAFVALIALGTIMIVAPSALGGKKPGLIYGEGLGRFLTVIIGEKHLTFAITFGAMAFSTFIFDTLDVSTRLGRYIRQELFGWQGRVAAVVTTGLTCAVPLAILLSAGPGSYLKFWTLFGTSNQLLAGISLLGITVWLKRSGRRYWFAAAPMVFVMAITLSSLVLQARNAFQKADLSLNVTFINGIVALLLLGLAGILCTFGLRAFRAEHHPST
jgi:carbon starvation protein